jgi:hypothetical protein
MASASVPRVKKRILDLTLSTLAPRVRRITAEADSAGVNRIMDELSA